MLTARMLSAVLLFVPGSCLDQRSACRPRQGSRHSSLVAVAAPEGSLLHQVDAHEGGRTTAGAGSRPSGAAVVQPSKACCACADSGFDGAGYRTTLVDIIRQSERVPSLGCSFWN